jgi:cupin fold WbuC family metalloprotein
VLEKYLSQNSEVLYSKDSITTATKSDIELFKQLSSQNSRKRIRLCAHNNPSDRLHEMLIVHERDAYVRPHKHQGKTESTHIIEGMVDVVIFDDNGQISRIIPMGDYDSGRIFYYRLTIPVFHTLIIHSDVLVFHETTNGPFNCGDTIFAPWSPEESDADSVRIFISDLHEKIRLFHNSNGS